VLSAYLLEGDRATAEEIAEAAIIGARRGDCFRADRCALTLPSFPLRRCAQIPASSSVAKSVSMRSQTRLIPVAALVNLDDMSAADTALRNAFTLSMHAIVHRRYQYY
jgi:hypothetical protein